MTENAPHFYDEKGGLEEFNLPLFIDPLFNNRWIITLIISACFLGGVVYNLYATPIYSAQSGIIIQIRFANEVIKTTTAETQGGVQNVFAFKTKIETITSEPILDKLVVKLIEHGYYRSLLESSGYAQMSEEKKRIFRHNFAGGLKVRITISNPKETNVAKISFLSADAVMARDVANFLADIVVEYNRDEQIMVMNQSLSWLNKQLEEARRRLEDIEGKLYAYRVKNNIFETDIDKQLVANRRSDLVEKVIDVQEQRREVEAKIAQLDRLLSRKDYTKFTPVLPENTLLQTLNEQLVMSEIEYEELLVRYDEKHPEVVRAGRKIETLKQKFQEELVKSRTQLDYSLNVIISRENLLQQSLAETEESAVTSTEKDIDYAVLDREAKSARDVYNTLLSAIKEVSINTNTMSNNVMYVNERASTPNRPVRPNKAVTMIIAMTLGVLLAAGFAYGREFWDQTVRHPDDVHKSVHLPVLSSIPRIGHKKKDEHPAAPILVIHSPKALFSESIISLRTQLSIKIPQERPVVILLTSSAPQEGKSLIASNLAASMALDNKKTLIIDGDLHRPSIHKMFKLTRQPGLFDLVVEALNPRLIDLDLNAMSLGDMQHLVRLKQWSGTMNIQWDSLPIPLAISFKNGSPVGSNFPFWKEKFNQPSGFPMPRNPSFSLDDSTIDESDSSEGSGKAAMGFIGGYARLCRSTYFADQVISRYILESDYKNLHIMLAGTNPKNPSEILGSVQMKILLEILKEKYERIIIDCPPAWPMSDVGVLSPLIDGVIWVCRAGRVPKNVFARNVQHIQQVQPNVLGVVLNAIDLERDRYYYGYSSYYYRAYKASYYYTGSPEVGDNQDRSKSNQA
jgi:uncharacterized protein involved in exopolysaccharide biosynthesis